MSAKAGKRSKRITNDDVEDTQSTDGTLVVALPLKVAKKKKKQTAPVKKRVTKDSSSTTTVRGGGISKTRRLKKTQSDKVLRALADGENLDYLENLISSLKKDEFEALRKKEEAKEKIATK